MKRESNAPAKSTNHVTLSGLRRLTWVENCFCMSKDLLTLLFSQLLDKMECMDPWLCDDLLGILHHIDALNPFSQSSHMRNTNSIRIGMIATFNVDCRVKILSGQAMWEFYAIWYNSNSKSVDLQRIPDLKSVPTLLFFSRLTNLGLPHIQGLWRASLCD